MSGVRPCREQGNPPWKPLSPSWGAIPISLGLVLLNSTAARAQLATATPSEDVEKITLEAQQTPESPLIPVDRPVYRAIQDVKKELNDRFGFTWAIENTTIYQTTSGGIDPNDALVNTLGLFATWKIFRGENGKDFGGIGFQFETRGNPLNEDFTDLRDDVGSLWSPNDSTSDSYDKINQLWWGQRLAEGRLGFMIGKIDPGAHINTNRFAGSGNTQFFSQPFATNPARSFPDNGLGFMARAEPWEWLHVHFTMSDSDAISTISPFKTLHGRWLYAGEIGVKPKLEGLGEGVYRVMVYRRDFDSDVEIGWSLSADQNLTERFGVFLRYGGNDGDLNAIEHLVAAGVSFLEPFGRKSDEAGIGVSYTDPLGGDLRDEYSAEVYYRVQVTEGFEVSGSAQVIVEPSAGEKDTVGVFGIRARLLY